MSPTKTAGQGGEQVDANTDDRPQRQTRTTRPILADTHPKDECFNPGCRRHNSFDPLLPPFFTIDQETRTHYEYNCNRPHLTPLRAELSNARSSIP